MKLIKFLTTVALTFAFCISVAASQRTDWFFKSGEANSQPVILGGSQMPKEYGALYMGENGDKTVYLTFDAGYGNENLEKILDILKKHNIPAAFFLVGNYITENPELVKRMDAEGHIVGNHTMHHPDMSEIAGKEDFAEELAMLEEVYQQTVGKEMKKFYRPPQGKYSEENLKQANELGYKTIFWSLAYVDWYENDQPSREEALNLLNRRIHPGAVVLLHSTSKTNAQILQELIQGWKEKGYVFRSLEELTEETAEKKPAV